MTKRLDDINCFYKLLDRLEEKVGGCRYLKDCNGRMDWPKRGVYFFFEDGEDRSGSGDGGRVVRVGANGVSKGSTTTLWGRLRAHYSRSRSGLGDYTGSIFRRLVGAAIAKQNNADVDASVVSKYIGRMPFLWLRVDGDPGTDSTRAFIERNAIRLLSGYFPPAVDGPSANWLGCRSNKEKVRLSGLWNEKHVDETYKPSFLIEMKKWIDAMPATA